MGVAEVGLERRGWEGGKRRPPSPPVGYVLDPVRERYPERYLLGPRAKDFGPERGTPPGWAPKSSQNIFFMNKTAFVQNTVER